VDRNLKCKHIYAVEIVKRREAGEIIEVPSIDPASKSPKITYKQNWPAYNKAQTTEKLRFATLLYHLCKPLTRTVGLNGRPRMPLSDIVFAIAFKVYSTVSTRRFMSDLEVAHKMGYISKPMHYNSICGFFQQEDLTAVLHELIEQSSLPLKTIEVDFACDSSGFTTSRFIRWFDHKYGVVRKQHAWVKVHLMCGVKTNIVTAVEIRDKDASDTKLLPSLVQKTAKHFSMQEISADKGYASLNNYRVIEKTGATPYIIFKSSHKGRGGGLWEKMYHLFQLNRDEFLSHYHKRSNVETTFSMIKAKFRDHVRCRHDVAMKNEVLTKILCHNICCVIQSELELGIDPSFWTSSDETENK
jgi:transposase